METTRKEALAKAREVLGADAIIMEELAWGMTEDGTVSVQRYVGVRGPDDFSWTVLGRGNTWDEAIHQATRRKRRRRRIQEGQEAEQPRLHLPK